MDSSITQEIFTCEICLQTINIDWKNPRLLIYGHCCCLSCIFWLTLLSLTVFALLLGNCYVTLRQILKIKKVTSKSILAYVKNVLKMGAVVITNAASLLYRYLQKVDMARVLKINCTSEVKPQGTKGKSFLSEGHCDEHNIYVGMRCMDCKVWICAMCGILHHKLCRTLEVKEAYVELKNQLSEKVETELEERKTSYERLDESLRTLVEEKKCLMDEINEKELEIKKREKLMEELKFRKSCQEKFSKKVEALHAVVKTTSVGRELSKVINELEMFLEIGKNENKGNCKTTPLPQAQGVKTQEMKTQDVKTQDIRSKELNPQDLKTQDLITQDLRTQELKTQDLKSEDFKTQDLKTQNLKIQDLKSQVVKTQELKTQEAKTQYWNNHDFKTQYLNTQDLNTQDLKTQYLKTQYLNTQDLNIQGLNTQDLKTQYLNTQDLNIQGLNTQDLKTQYLNTQVLNTQDLKTQDLKTQQQELKITTAKLIESITAKYNSKLPVMQRKTVTESIQ